MGLNTGYKKHGKSGLVVGDWWKHVGACADDLAVVRSLWTTDNDHGAQLQWHTGRHVREGAHPTIGSWVSYGLGTLNAEPARVRRPRHADRRLLRRRVDARRGLPRPGVRRRPPRRRRGRPAAVRHAGPRPSPPTSRRPSLGLLGKLNRLAGIDYPDDADLRARIKSYELAFGMQTAVPETLDLDKETAATRSSTAWTSPTTQPVRPALPVGPAAGRERGVRFVQIFHGGGGRRRLGRPLRHQGEPRHALGAGRSARSPACCKDLKQRGMLDDTLVVWGTEFGRSPGAQGDGRDHHPQGFCAWLAGGGIKGGVVHGATDEIGFHAVENRHYVTDIHATVLHQLGLDSRRLEVPGRKRLEIDHGKVIKEIIA